MVAEVIIGTIWNKYSCMNLICLVNSKEKELTLVQIMSLKFKCKILKVIPLYCLENESRNLIGLIEFVPKIPFL